MRWKRFSCRSAGTRTSTWPRSRSRTQNVNAGKRSSSTAAATRTPAAPATSVIPTAAPSPRPSGTEPQLQHQRRRRSHPARNVESLPEGRRLRADRQPQTAPSATARSTRHPWWKRQTPRRSFTTTSRARSKTSSSSTPDPNSTDPRAPDRHASTFNQHADRPDRRLPARSQHAPEHRRRPARAPGNPREQGNPRREQDTRLQTAFEETADAIDVLKEGGLFPSAMTHLIAARNLISQAQVTELRAAPDPCSAGDREARPSKKCGGNYCGLDRESAGSPDHRRQGTEGGLAGRVRQRGLS